MTKSTITRERLQELVAGQSGFNLRTATHEESQELARMALAAMDCEPVAWTWHYREQWHVTNDKCRAEFVATDGDVAVLPLYRHAQPVLECEQLAIENFRSAMEGIGHIRRTLEETFGGLHGTHVEPDVLAECKAICDAIYAAYGHAASADSGLCTLGDSPYDVPYSMPSNLREFIDQEIGILFSDDDAQGVWIACRRAAMLNGGKP